MKRTSQILTALLLAMLISPWMGTAQSVAVVDSNDPRAHVYADSTWLGNAGQQVFEVPAGTRQVRVVPNAVGTWGMAGHVAPVVGADTTFVRAPFPYTYRLEATPMAAQVFLESPEGREPLGRTPVVVSRETPPDGRFVFERAGFAAVELVPGRELWNRHQAVMQPAVEAAMSPAEVHLEMGGGSRKWIDYAAVGAALIGGTLAVHYKLKADNRFDEYLETGDPTLRPRIEQLDTRSAVALGAMQTGVTVFALRLVLRQ